MKNMIKDIVKGIIKLPLFVLWIIGITVLLFPIVVFILLESLGGNKTSWETESWGLAEKLGDVVWKIFEL